MASRTGTTSGATPAAPPSARPPVAARPDSGEAAEARVHERLRQALPAEYRIHRNWRWVVQRASGAPARDGETDLVIVHPEQGVLVLVVKAHLRRDGSGRWFAGERLLDASPFAQAETGKHALRDKILGIDGWTGTAADLRLAHAVAVPSQDLAATRARIPVALGADVEPWMVLDQTALETGVATRRWVDEAYAHWNGDGRRGRPLTDHEMGLIDRLLAPGEQQLYPSLRIDVAHGEAEVRELAPSQRLVLGVLELQRRAAISGPAGTGKTVLAIEKARRLAQELPTLLACFNAPLARFMTDALGPDRPRTLDVLTFHELCLRLATKATTATEPPRERRDRTWWEETLPTAALAAIDILGRPYRAIVVDEGQDFQRDWLDLLQLLLVDPASDPFIVFHDPLQALFRPDVVDSLGLPAYPLPVNLRNTRAIHEYAASFVGGLPGIEAWRDMGRQPRLVPATDGTPEALRRVLHELVVTDRIVPWHVAVLSGRSMAESEVWRVRRFGDQVLWNGAYDDDGTSLGLPFTDYPEPPDDVIVFDSIRRFKGLEREVIVLVELDRGAPDVDRLMYVGASRARQHLVVIGSSSA